MTLEELIAEYIATQAPVSEEAAMPQAEDLAKRIREHFGVVELSNPDHNSHDDEVGWTAGESDSVWLDSRGVISAVLPGGTESEMVYPSDPVSLAAGLLSAEQAAVKLSQRS